MAKKSSKSARKSPDPKPSERRERRIDKEFLFEDFFQCAHRMLHRFEDFFGTEGAWAAAMGVDGTGDERIEFRDAAEERMAKEHIRQSLAWHYLSALYDYANDGIVADDTLKEAEFILGSEDVLSLLTNNGRRPAEAWDQIIAMGDGRFALDCGVYLEVDKLALLAAVDVRTVRNAISAGELVSVKEGTSTLVENDSARHWLGQRKGFKPTRTLQSDGAELKDISSPVELGNLLVAQRTRLGIKLDAQKLLVFHPLVNAKVLNELERGVFQLPLDVVFPLADFYQVDRDALLACVMRSFFKDQLVSLASSIRTE